MPQASTDRPVHNIGVVVRRTGLKADLVRAWERRYQAVVPHRTDTDRRLYSDADLERLVLLRNATRAGHRIGHIASLSDDDLAALVRSEPMPSPEEVTGRSQPMPRRGSRPPSPRWKTSTLPVSPRCSSGPPSTSGAWSCGVAARAVDGEDRPLVARRPPLTPPRSHLASATVRSFVSSFLAASAPPTAPTVLVTTPAGQRHELGAVLAAATAAAAGCRVLFLGADLPAASIVHAAHRSGATAVALGITYPDATPDLVGEVDAIAAVSAELVSWSAAGVPRCWGPRLSGWG